MHVHNLNKWERDKISTKIEIMAQTWTKVLGIKDYFCEKISYFGGNGTRFTSRLNTTFHFVHQKT